MSLTAPSRSPATLPWFARRLWVSDKARDTWEPVLTEFAECWRQLEWLSVAEGVRPCATFFVSQSELAALAGMLKDYGLSATTLTAEVCEVPRQKEKMLRYRVVIGRRRDANEFAWAWEQKNDEAIGRFLGYPECCTAFHASLVKDEIADGLWRVAKHSAHAVAENQEHEVRTGVVPETNPFWRSLGVQLTAHLSCRFECEESVALGRKFVECGRHAGYGALMDRALEMLSWPVEWSSLHGIAEVRTPVLKICQPAEPSFEKRIIRLRSDRFPELGAHALYERLTGAPKKAPARGRAHAETAVPATSAVTAAAV